MKVILSAFSGSMKGLYDIPTLLPEIKMVIPKRLDYMRIVELPDNTMAKSNRIATFDYTSNRELHFQYGEIPVYELGDIS